MVRAPEPAQIALVATLLPRIVRAAMAIARTLHVPRAPATDPTHRVPPAMAIRVLRAPAVTDRIQLDRHATVILAHHEVMAIAPTLRALRVMVIRVHVVMATARTLHVRRVMATAPTRPARVAMATLLVARRAQAVTGPIPLVRPETATDPIPHAHRATARARIAPMAIARAPIVLGMTGLAQTGRGAIDLTATSPAATGSPMAVNDVRTARR
jgi:hypothetical protein